MAKQDAMISIDFWDTLVDGRVGGDRRREVRHNALIKISKKYARNLSEAEINSASRGASKEFNRVWFGEKRTPGTDELVAHMLDHLSIPATPDEMQYLIEVFEESLLEGSPGVLNGAKDTIRSLSERYKLTLISDTMYSPGRVIRAFLREEGLLDRFSGFLFSNEAGFSKPDPRAFHQMLEDTGCTAGLSYHIGDRLNTDIAGAKEAGMQAILFTGISMKSDGAESEAEPDHRCASWQEVHKLLL